MKDNELKDKKETEVSHTLGGTGMTLSDTLRFINLVKVVRGIVRAGCVELTFFSSK
jgi:hypothetical protein